MPDILGILILCRRCFMNSTPCKFLLIAGDNQTRFLLGRTLLRKFPMSSLLECDTAASALELPPERDLDVIVVHVAAGSEGLKSIAALHRRYPDAKVVIVADADLSRAAADAGADRFLLQAEWLRLGTMAEDLLAAGGGGCATA